MACLWLMLFFVIVYISPLTAEEGSYTFGVVPQYNARQIHAVWRPLLSELEKSTGFEFSLVGSPTIPAFEEEFIDGRFDFAYMNPYHISRAARSQGYIPLVRDVGQMLYGIIVVREDSPIQGVQELDGQVVAFPAPNAVAASMIPRLDFRDIFQITVQPLYVRSHDSVYLNVLLGQVVAGGGVQKTLSQQSEAVRNGLRLIYRTREFAPHPVASHPRVPQAVREKVQQAFLQLGETEQGRVLLAKVPIRQIGLATMVDYQPLTEWGLEYFYDEE